ncbi:MAG TPA: tetratricopeptide repeat protein [Actinomycetota bacterium]
MGAIGGTRVRARGDASPGLGPGPSVPERRRGRRRLGITILAVVALAVAMLAVGGLGLFGRGSRSPQAGNGSAGLGNDPAGALSGHPVIRSGSLRQAIDSLRARLAAVPEDWAAWAELGLAYVQQARVTADPSFYPKAQGALRRSLALHAEGNFEAFTGEGALAAARHDFVGALHWGDRARDVNPYNGNVYGVIGDAQLELGRYRAAFATFQHMVDLKPDLASYARASYARELQGDVEGAASVMRLALSAAGTPQDRAFAAYQLGELAFNRGDLVGADHFFRMAAASAPEYFPPQAGLARLAWARGDTNGAIKQFGDIVARYPSPEYVIALGDLYTVSGEAAKAGEQYDLVRAEERLFQAAGVNVDLELALFDADHGDPGRAVAEARTEWGRRHSILVADALAWSLYRDGRAGEALRYSRFARSLGYRSATILFHAGMIERATGDDASARRDLRAALRINPHFSILHGGEARDALAALEASS